MSEPLLTIGYSVLGERAAQIRFPPERPDVEILVVTQGPTSGWRPDRPDVRHLPLESRGVAKSRNHVLDRATGRFVLFADDDIVLAEAGVRAMLAEFQRKDDLALVLGAAVDEQGRLRKRYPRRSVRLHRWNCGKAATYEMMLRLHPFTALGLRFDEQFGAGADQYLGDEYILIADALTEGLECRFFPHVLAMHPATSSGLTYGTVRDAVARSVVFDRVFGRRAPVARLAFVLRRPSRFRSLPLTMRFVAGRFHQPG